MKVSQFYKLKKRKKRKVDTSNRISEPKRCIVCDTAVIRVSHETIFEKMIISHGGLCETCTHRLKDLLTSALVEYYVKMDDDEKWLLNKLPHREVKI